MSASWVRFEEPFRRTLARNVTIAALVGAGLALQRHHIRLFFPLAILALWFSLGGHYVEIAFLNGLRARIPPGRPAQVVVRLLCWAAGGIVLYLGMALTGRALPINAPALGLWWYGAFLLIGIELVVHAIMAIRSLPNFYDGRG